MKMQMLIQTGSGSLAFVQTDIDAVALIHIFDRLFASSQHRDQILPDLVFKGGEAAFVLVRTEHDMPVVVGITIHDDEAVLAPVEDKFVPVLFWILMIAEEAGTVLFGEDVIEPPGRIKIVLFLRHQVLPVR